MKSLLASAIALLVVLTASARAIDAVEPPAQNLENSAVGVHETGRTADGRACEQRLTKMRVRALVELKDGSRLVGAPVESSLPVTLDFMKASIPIEKIRSCDFHHKDERVVMNFLNGDKLTGGLNWDKFRMETVLGKLLVEIAQVDRITFSAWDEGKMPAGEGDVSFGGVNWQTWRTPFEIQGDKLVSLPRARPGFNYGHWGNGRGAALATNIGNSDWRDYRVEFEYCVTGINPAFNLHGLGADYYGGGFSFHVADAKESWNESGTSAYTLSLDSEGGWNLSCIHNQYCQQPVGFGNLRMSCNGFLDQDLFSYGS